jgi:hypothetical protein
MTPHQAQFLLTLDRLTDSDPAVAVDLNNLELAAGLHGMSRARVVAQQLEGKRYVRFERQGGHNAGRVWITPAGTEEAQRLRRPWWQRLFSRPAALPLGSSVIGGVIASAVTQMVAFLTR